MPLSTDITLPKYCEPKFPDRCLVCHQKPDSTTKVAQHGQNPLLEFFVPLLLFFGWSQVEIPVCRRCKLRFRLQRWGRELICWTVVVLAVWLIMPHFSGWSHFTRKIVVGALVLLAISPYILAEVLWPRIFDTTARKDSIDYEFASSTYAREFYDLNRDSVVQPVCFE